MQTRVSTKGQVVLPGPTRRKLNIRAGDVLDVSVETGDGAERIVLTRANRPKFEGKIIADPITGLPVLDFGPDAPELTNEMIAELLVDFP